MNEKPFLCLGHRGASGYEPENTLLSLRTALEMGADGVEIDVRISADGHPVVIHDAKVTRTTGVRGIVSRMPLERLRALDAGKGERIPTLDEVLALVAGTEGAKLNVELKSAGSALAALNAVRRSLEAGAGWRREQLIFSSFDRSELLVLRRELDADPVLAQAVGIGLLLARWPLRAGVLINRIGATTLHLSRRLVTASRVRRAHEMGLKVLVYTVNEVAERDRLLALGVDGIFSDYPDRLLADFAQESSPCGPGWH